MFQYDCVIPPTGWHKSPDTLFDEQNINSVIWRPAHDEVLSLARNDAYTMKGYALTGGGRRIVRVAVSLDEGANWRVAEIIR